MIDRMLSRLEDFSQVNSLVDTMASPDKSASRIAKKKSSVIDVQLERNTAYQEGYAAAKGDQEDWESKIAVLQEAHLSEISDLRAKFEAYTGEMISIALKDVVKSLSNSLEREVVRILMTVLEVGLARKSAVELAKCVTDFLKKGECDWITVHGSKSLHKLIKKHLGEYSSMVRYKVSDEMELSTEISHCLITTRLESWATDVKKILE
ncbi:hypothetical protein [Candidatus Liberibacter sp.]|uniref:hypothetical protein n=1 Tax=Candidatus Liberibacter sp. TaxID=34022 RepID=UPI0015F3B0C8|nr:hypothetical protein [Candidatus Liberibacter sp.]MBA5724078.1 hypothetical protein [Candidatus Liberibacter sp.]